jgi:predicted Zn-dependent protease
MLSRDPDEIVPGSIMTLEHRAAVPASITYEEFAQFVLAGQAREAIDKVRALRKTQPDHMLLSETYLQRLVWSLRNTWGLSTEALPVIQFWNELYPSSDGAQWMLAEAYIDLGEFSSAIKVYTRLLDRHPENDTIRTRLEWLGRQ